MGLRTDLKFILLREAPWSCGRALAYGAESPRIEFCFGQLKVTGKRSLLTQKVKVAKGEEMGTILHLPCPCRPRLTMCRDGPLCTSS